MVSNPQIIPGDGRDALAQRVTELERQVAALTNKTANSVVIGSGGITVDGGSITIEGGDILLSPGGHIKDGAGNIVFSVDGHSNQRLSTPFIPVPMYPEFQNRTTGAGFMTCLASDIGTSEKTVWEGTIPQVVAPQLMWKFVGGDLSSRTVTVTYRLYINSQEVDSFSANNTLVYSTSELSDLDITSLTTYGLNNAQVVVTAQCSVSNADQIACQMIGVSQCGR